MSFGSARVMWSTLRVRDLIKKFTNKKINISKKETKEDTEEIKEDTEETKEVEYYSTDKKCLVTIKIPSHMTILKKSNNHTNNIHTYSLDHCYKHEKRIEEAHSGDFEENFKKEFTYYNNKKSDTQYSKVDLDYAYSNSILAEPKFVFGKGALAEPKFVFGKGTLAEPKFGTTNN
jgi:hypothetical protein